MELVRAWPKCKEPVTLGGGMHIIKMPFGLGSPALVSYNAQNQQHKLTQHACTVTNSIFWFKKSLVQKKKTAYAPLIQ